ncbi:MAG: PhnD/SsuA/transferrin family substrate-binding protein [Thiobacillus sp.]
MFLHFFGLVLFSLLCVSSAHAARELVIGLLPYQPVRALISNHTPLAAHLQKTLKRPVRLVTAKDTRVFGQRMLAGNYELVLAPAHLARLAQVDRGWQPLARYQPDTSVVLLARNGEDAITPADLRGKVLAVPDRAMLVTVVSEAWLEHQHLLAGRDFTLLVTGGFSSALHALTSGRADMALGVESGMEQARIESLDQLRIVEEVGTIPSLVFAARHDVPPAMRDQILRALLAYRSPTPLCLTAIGELDLIDMDTHLPMTRQRLGTPSLPTAALQ